MSCGARLAQYFQPQRAFPGCGYRPAPQIRQGSRKHVLSFNFDKRNYPAADSKCAVAAIATMGVRPAPSTAKERSNPPFSTLYNITSKAGSTVQSKKSPRAYNHNHNSLSILNVTAKENLSEIPTSASPLEQQVGYQAVPIDRADNTGDWTLHAEEFK